VIDIRCGCGALYHAEERQAGRHLRCTHCQAILTIQLPATVHSINTSGARPIEVTPHVNIPTEVSIKPKGLSSTFVGLMGVALAIVFISVVVWWIGIGPNQVPTSPTGSGGLASNPPSVGLPGPPPSVHGQTQRASPIKHSPDRSAGRAQLRLPEGDSLPSTPIPVRLPPCAQGQPVERLFTGQRIEDDDHTDGTSTLLVTNGTGYDAAVRLVNSLSGRTTRFVYVQAADAYKLSDIEPGSYRLIFMTGADWVVACRGFLRAPSYSEFEGELVFKFSSTQDEDAVTTWTTHGEVTLNPVIGGNAKLRKIDRKRFFEGDQYVAVDP